MKKRVCYIEISTPSGEKRIKNIALKGTVTRRMGSVSSEASISVANLSKEDIEYLSTYASSYVEPDRRKTISVFAGYEDSGFGLIFSGDIIQAKPEGETDIWLKIDAKSNYFNRQNIITCSIDSPVASEQFAQNVAKEMGATLSWKSKSKKFIDSFNFAGAKAKLIDELNKYGDFTAFLDNDVLYVVDKDDSPPEESSSESGVKLINSSSGLIGVPEITEYGISFKVLLDPTLNPADWVRVESEVFPAINGFYQIYNLKYDFSSMEKNFYCEIEGKNFQRG